MTLFLRAQPCSLFAFACRARGVASSGGSFVWPPDLEKMVFTIVTRTKLIEQRERAAATLTRYVLARLVVPSVVSSMALAGPCVAVATQRCHAFLECAARGACGFDHLFLAGP